MPAQYFCSGEVPKDQWHHYGLAAPVYTHFTSPIRRYADVVVHRLLAAAIGVIALPVINADRSKQQELCSHMNRRHRAAQYVQRASVSMHTLLYFKSVFYSPLRSSIHCFTHTLGRDRPCVEPAYVSSTTAASFTVLIPRFGIEASLDVDLLATELDATFTFDPVLHLIVFTGEDNGREHERLRLQVFQQVQVAIRTVEAAGGTRRLEVTLANALPEGTSVANEDRVDNERETTSHQQPEEDPDEEDHGGEIGRGSDFESDVVIPVLAERKRARSSIEDAKKKKRSTKPLGVKALRRLSGCSR